MKNFITGLGLIVTMAIPYAHAAKNCDLMINIMEAETKKEAKAYSKYADAIFIKGHSLGYDLTTSIIQINDDEIYDLKTLSPVSRRTLGLKESYNLRFFLDQSWGYLVSELSVDTNSSSRVLAETTSKDRTFSDSLKNSTRQKVNLLLQSLVKAGKCANKVTEAEILIGNE